MGTLAPLLYRDVLHWSPADAEATAVAQFAAASFTGRGSPVALTLRLIR